VIRVFAHPVRAGWRRFWFDCDACGLVRGPVDEPIQPPDPEALPRRLEQFGGVVVRGAGLLLHEVCCACASSSRPIPEAYAREARWRAHRQLSFLGAAHC
jgi:hypothetical protein